MADIAFLLLIFFLVTTTMDSDTGLMRRLPPMVDPDLPKPEDTRVNDRNVLEVKVNKDNLLLVENQFAQLTDLREITINFILNPNDDINMAEKELVNVPHFGDVMISKAVISITNDIGTSYGAYIAVQNELLAARDKIRNDLSLRTWGVEYEKLDEDRQLAVDQYYFAPISEAEPKRGGKN